MWQQIYYYYQIYSISILRHVCTIAACFSQSSEDAPLQTLLSVTPTSVFFLVVPVKWLVIIGHVNRSFYLLTYFTIRSADVKKSVKSRGLQQMQDNAKRSTTYIVVGESKVADYVWTVVTGHFRQTRHSQLFKLWRFIDVRPILVTLDSAAFYVCC